GQAVDRRRGAEAGGRLRRGPAAGRAGGGARPHARRHQGAAREAGEDRRGLGAAQALSEGQRKRAGPKTPPSWRASDRRAQTLRTFVAWRPLGPFCTSNSTLSPSLSERKPSDMIAVWWTNTSGPSARVMKPKPFASLNHFTVPVSILRPSF